MFDRYRKPTPAPCPSRSLQFWARILPMVIAVVSAHSVSAVQFTAVNIGSLGGEPISRVTSGPGTYVFADINDSGQVAGTSLLANNTTIGGFSAPANTVISASSNLGSLGGTNSYAEAVNDSGEVVGYSDNGHAYRTAPNGVVTASADIYALPFGSAQAYGINSSGEVVGTITGGGPIGGAFRTLPDGTITTSSLIGGATGYGINDSGQVVGTNTAGHAFRTAPEGSVASATDLGVFGGFGSVGFAINSSGQTVGYATNASGIAQAFRTTATGVIDQASMLVAAPGVTVEKSEAFGINDAGQTVGYYETPFAQPAFFADADGVMQDLDSLIINNSRTGIDMAFSINNEGQILAASNSAFYVLTPVAVPEPGAFFSLGITSISLLLRAKRR
jgi:probable HAF family extracellular repeat protein